MNRLEHLLTILCEECAEVQQATSKAKRFGLHNGQIKEAVAYGDNVEAMREEINHVLAMVEMLMSEGLDLSPDHSKIEAKKKRVEKYLDYSVECGTLNKD